jgi:RNA ligase
MFSLDTLRDYESRGLIKSSERDGYTVWCYTQQAVFSRSWDDVTLSCRGLIMAPDGTLVARPFRKFFNWNEPEAVIEKGAFVAFDKMDGTLIVVGEHDGSAVVSTKGSFDTWHSEVARKLLLGYTPPKGVTVLFELLHPQNRVVIDYDGYEGLVLLGGVDNETGQDFLPDEVADNTGWHGDVVVRRTFNFQSMLRTIENPEAGAREDGTVDREGFVVLWRHPNAPGNRVKLKFSLYVQLHGVYTGLTTKRVWEAMCDGTLDALYELAPDELHKGIRHTVDAIQGQANRLAFKAHDAAEVAKKFNNRKDAAQYLLSHTERPTTSLAFLSLDGRDGDMYARALALAKPEVSEFIGNFS